MAHGFTQVNSKGRCFLKYNSKGFQVESAISPIKLQQLFIPFLFLICGYLLAFFQFLRELMHGHFRRQMMIEQENAARDTNAALSIDMPPSNPDISSHPITAAKSTKPTDRPTLEKTAAPTVEPLEIVVDIDHAATVIEPTVIIGPKTTLKGSDSKTGPAATTPEIELKTFVVEVDIHQAPATKSIIEKKKTFSVKKELSTKPKVNEAIIEKKKTVSAKKELSTKPAIGVNDISNDPDVSSKPYEIK